MARRRRAGIREITPDPKYGRADVARFINRLMLSGKKSVAQKIVYQALDKLAQETHRDSIEMFELAMRNVTPVLEVRPRRVGGATYQVPIEVRSGRREAMAIRWVIGAARSQTGAPMAELLYRELLEASRGQGTAVKRREDLHRMAEANRAFVHYRW